MYTNWRSYITKSGLSGSALSPPPCTQPHKDKFITWYYKDKFICSFGTNG